MTGATVHVWPESPRDLGEAIGVRAQLERPGADRTPLWFRFPSQHLDVVTESADPFVLASLFPAMRHADRLRVHGRASVTLLRNLEEFQVAWARWFPDRYRPVEVVADDEVDVRATATDRAVLAFSGGLDSCFSALRHTRGDCGRATREIVAGVMVHGFDIPLEETDTFDRAAENSRRILDSLGLPLITVTCNLREVNDELDANWVDSHAALIAACLNVIRGECATGLIASSHAYDALRFPWGSNPLTDPMLSSAAFSILNDGGGYDRMDKARGVARWPEAVRGLRVCFEGPHLDRNCGECPTCVHTALCFAVLGGPQPDSLPVESLERAVEGLAGTPLDPNVVLRFEELLTRARASDIEDPWVDAIDRMISAQRRQPSRLRRLLRSGAESR